MSAAAWEALVGGMANVCLLSCLWAQHPWPIWAGADMDAYDASQIQRGSASGGR